MCSVYTIGYEGKDLNQLIQLLENNDINTLIDVRELAISRRPGFSKNRLSAELENNGITYIHMPQLGSPRNIRHRLHDDHNYIDFFYNYHKHLIERMDDLNNAMFIAENGHTCLMCFEHEPSQCHRSVISLLICSYSKQIDKVVDIL